MDPVADRAAGRPPALTTFPPNGHGVYTPLRSRDVRANDGTMISSLQAQRQAGSEVRMIPMPRLSAPNSSSPAEVACRAYALYEQGGRQDGHDVEHWFMAEAQLSAERNNPLGVAGGAA